MTLTRLQVGQRILEFPAQSWNEMCDIAERMERYGDNPQQIPHSAQQFMGSIVSVQNTTGGALPFPGVIGLDKPYKAYDANDQDKSRNTVDGVTPNTQHGDNFGVYLEAAADRQYAPAVVMGGPVWVDVDVTDTDHEFAAIIPGDTAKLRSSAGGHARILPPFTPLTVGVQKCRVMIGTSAAVTCEAMQMLFGLDPDNYPDDEKDRVLKFVYDAANSTINCELEVINECPPEGFGSMGLSAPVGPGPDLSAGWTNLDMLDELRVPGSGITFDLPNGRFAHQHPGTYALSINIALQHDELNAGRLTDVQLYNFTSAAAAGSTEIGIGRNNPATSFSATFMYSPTSTDFFGLRMGNGDAVDVTTWDGVSLSISQVSSQVT